MSEPTEVIERDGWKLNLYSYPQYRNGEGAWSWYLHAPIEDAGRYTHNPIPADGGSAPDRETARKAAGAAFRRLTGTATVQRPSPSVEAVKVAHNASETSQKAAERVRPKSGSQREKVLEFIQDADMYGATDAEISFHLGLAENSVRPRRLELVEMGWVADSGLRRKTTGGNEAIVWVDAIHVTGINVA